MKIAKLNNFLKNDKFDVNLGTSYYDDDHNFDLQISRVSNTDSPLRKIISNLINYSFL